MDINTILNIVKTKLFEPRKKVVNTVGGKKITLPSPNGEVNNQTLEENEKSIFEIVDGWNVADRDYVEWRVSEALRGKGAAPSAPAPNTTNFYCSADVVDGVANLFYPGVVLKSGTVIDELSVVCDSPSQEDAVLSVKVNNETKTTHKIKFGNKAVYAAAVGINIDANSCVSFVLKFAKNEKAKAIPKSVSFQIQVSV
ncbi:hypothetical protein AV955_gp023 [Diadromus pulchellus ascovirus 4a]|uniref:Complete DpAV4 genome n=1 Tax=Diadromus pulchellus ascovirus 4a TaxID=158683 RepID=F2NYV2_9VIRU|nr:hypothetical protein AV955_gp023 [Diadromus pulchellus ascovirus 4a]CCA61380.1 unnamed protein product [Diadromus pulchellus ascovirus 4a]